MRLERLINDFMVLQQLEVGIHKREVDKKATKVNLKKLMDDIVANFKASLKEDKKI